MTRARTREKRKHIKNLLIPVLEEHIWPLLQPEGFSWRRSLRFRRGGPSVRQVLEFVLRLSPKRNDPVMAYICPWITVRIPRLGERARELVGSPDWFSVDPGIVIHQSAGWVGPERSDEKWILLSEEDLPDLGHSLAELVQKHVIPFLNRYRSSRDIVEGWEAEDDRLSLPVDGWIQVAAAYLDVGRKEQAAKLLWSKVRGNADLRMKYRHALTYLGIDSIL